MQFDQHHECDFRSDTAPYPPVPRLKAIEVSRELWDQAIKDVWKEFHVPWDAADDVNLGSHQSGVVADTRPIREPMEETCLFSFSVKKATKVTIRQKQFSCRRALGCFATNKRRCLQNLLARLVEVRRRGYWLRDLYNLDPI